eukprot:gene1018-339_t
MSPSISQGHYNKINKQIFQNYQMKGKKNLKDAARQLIDPMKKEQPQNVQIKGRVLDYEIKSVYCHECTKHRADDPTSESYNKWQEDHVSKCNINHTGFNDSMEAEGGISIFLRSVDLGLRYTTFVGDGDSSCYGDVSRGLSCDDY